MNRKEYLQALEAALGAMPEEVRRAALDFYGEMIDDRMEDGMDELSAVAAMEKPEDIAARLQAETAGHAAAKAPDAADQPADMEDDAMEFSSLAEKVIRAASQAMEGVPQLVNAGMQQAQEAVKQAEEERAHAEDARVQASVEMEDRPNFREEKTDGEYSWKTFTCPVSQVQAIRLYAVDMPISMMPCTGDTVTLRYYTSNKNPYTLNLADGVLTLHHPEKSLFRDGFSLEWLGGLMRIAWSRPTPTIHLEMPADAFVDLLAHTSNGSVKAGGFSALCDVDLATSNSRIELMDTVCKALEMASSNGRLVLQKVESKQRLRCKTSNSRIEADHVRSGEGVTLHTSNASIQAEHVRAQGDLTLKTSNGRISVEDVLAAAVTIKTSNGGISGVLPGSQADWAIDSHTSNGHNSLPESQPGARPLSVHTSNASISLKFRG